MAEAQIQVTRILVTPEMAATWLDRNEANRSIRKTAVARLANDMATGYWVETNPQPIIIDPSGAVIDGQHRLSAIVKSGRAVWLFVASNVPRSTQLVIDDHIKRDVADYAKWEMPGHKITSQHAAVARVMMRGSKSTAFMKPSRSLVYRFMREHLPAIEFALGVFTKRVPNVTNAMTFGVLARAFYSRDHDQLRRFAEVLETGQMADPKESAAATLGRWLLERSRREQREIYAKIERALQAFLDGEALSKVYAAKEELFLLPVEKEALSEGSTEPVATEVTSAEDNGTTGIHA
jgi:hypothetical protein